MSLIVAVGTSVILFVFNIDLVLFFGLITFVLNFIPNVDRLVELTGWVAPPDTVIPNPTVGTYHGSSLQGRKLSSIERFDLPSRFVAIQAATNHFHFDGRRDLDRNPLRS